MRQVVVVIVKVVHTFPKVSNVLQVIKLSPAKNAGRCNRMTINIVHICAVHVDKQTNELADEIPHGISIAHPKRNKVQSEQSKQNPFGKVFAIKIYR